MCAYQRPAIAPLTPLPWPCGRVRVALLVGVRVVLAVVGDPVHDRALHRHRAEDRDRVLHRFVGLERTVRQQPVEAERDAHGP